MSEKMLDTVLWAGLTFTKPADTSFQREVLYFVEGPGSEHISLRYIVTDLTYKATYADANVSARWVDSEAIYALANLYQVLSIARDTIANMVDEDRKTKPAPIPEEIRWRHLVLKKIPSASESSQLVIYSCENISILFLVFHKTDRTWLATFGKTDKVINVMDEDPHLALNKLRDKIMEISTDLTMFVKVSSGLAT